MTARVRAVIPDLLLALAGLAIGAVLCILAVEARVAAAGPVDPVVLTDHAERPDPCLEPSGPPVKLRPSAWTRFRAGCERVGKNTGGAPLVFGVGGLMVVLRRRWPSIRRGRKGRLTAGIYAAALWAGVSLQQGWTWSAAATGVIVSLVTGVAWASVPGEVDGKPVASDGTKAAA